MTRTVQVVDTLMDAMLHEPAIAGHLLQMAGHERSTASHMLIVASLAMTLGGEIFGTEEQDLIQCLGTAGMLHDIGKLSVPESILKKTSPLTRQELTVLQQHPIESVRLVSNDPTVSSMARQIILQHHERLDGRGYPLGLSEDEILMATRIVSLVDAFHAMVGRRTYRESMGATQANRILKTQVGKQFDPEVLRVWEKLCDERKDACDGNNTVSVMMSDLPVDEIATRDEHKPTPAMPDNLDRRPARHQCRGETSVRCVYAGRLAGGQESAIEFSAPVFDISRSGICIHTDTPLYRGELLNVRISVHGEYVWLRSMVAWCRHLGPCTYKNGLQFVSKLSAGDSYKTATLEAAQGLVSPSEKENRLDEVPGELQFNASAESEQGDEEKAGKKAAGKKGNNQLIDKDSTGFTGSRSAKRMATLASSGLRSKSTQKEIIALAMSGDIETRVEGARLMGRINTKQSRQALCVLLNDKNRAVRESAIVTCGTYRVRQSIDELHTKLKGDDVQHALYAAESLALMDDKSGLRLAASLLKRNLPESRLAARVVGEITGHEFAANREGIKAALRYLKAKQLLPT